MHGLDMPRPFYMHTPPLWELPDEVKESISILLHHGLRQIWWNSLNPQEQEQSHLLEYPWTVDDVMERYFTPPLPFG